MYIYSINIQCKKVVAIGENSKTPVLRVEKCKLAVG